ncbi:MAG: hypothetical protein HC859_03870 [Bacteroidia bacterium]|nr:hypothetical protein [Bacteroidia bacterium]
MNLPFFISRRLRQQQQDGFSSTTHKIAVVSIGIGLAAVIVSFLIMRGFQETVKHKIFNFSGHLLITKYSMSNSLEGAPMDYNIEFYKNYDQYPGVAHVQEYAYKTGLIKTDDEVLGIAVKGVGKSFDVNAFAENIIEGEFLHVPDSGYSTDIVLSKTIADLVRAKVGDKLVIHFFQTRRACAGSPWWGFMRPTSPSISTAG